MIILELGISYIKIGLYTNINWNTLINNKNKYITEMNTDIKYLYIDTTFIYNKNGKQLL